MPADKYCRGGSIRRGSEPGLMMHLYNRFFYWKCLCQFLWLTFKSPETYPVAGHVTTSAIFGLWSSVVDRVGRGTKPLKSGISAPPTATTGLPSHQDRFSIISSAAGSVPV